MRVGFVTACLVALGACSDDEGEDDGTGVPASCQAIIDACHEAEEAGVEGAAECHETGHHEVEADCDAQKDACIALCEASTPS